MEIRRAEAEDIPQIVTLLYQVHKVHSDARPDLFRAGAKKYTAEELAELIPNDERPIFVAEENGQILGYAFCIFQMPKSDSMQPIQTLYVDDLCVDGSIPRSRVCGGKGLLQRDAERLGMQCLRHALLREVRSDGSEDWHGADYRPPEKCKKALTNG